MVTMKELVTLVLGEDRIEAIRDDLASKSEYFAVLLSSKFNDGSKKEHRINYDIETKILQTFVSWTSDRSTDSTSTEFDRRNVKPSLAKLFKHSAQVEDVVQLLRLSLLFIAETLAKELIDLIACHWLSAETALSFWSIAKELNFETLRNLAKAECLGHIDKIPRSLLLELPAKDFLELSTNFSHRLETEFLDAIVSQWNEYNMINGNSQLEIRHDLNLSGNNVSDEDDYSEKLFRSSIHCVAGRKKTENNKLKACIYSWDGENFRELVELRHSSTHSDKDIVGRQVVAVGFDIYCVGGEYGLGTGRFELDIWRYSTISKIWYYVTSLLEPRRHMAVEYVRGSLFLIGGIGRHRLKLDSVHRYDICSGRWNKLAQVPVTFTSVPLTHSYGGHIHLYHSHLYYYVLDEDRWIQDLEQECDSYYSCFPSSTQYMMTYRDRRYIIDTDDSNISIRRRISSFEKNVYFVAEISHVAKFVTPFSNQAFLRSYLIGFSCENETISVEVVKITGSKSVVPVLVHKEKRPEEIHDFFCQAPVGCFSIPKVSTLIDDNGFKSCYRITPVVSQLVAM